MILAQGQSAEKGWSALMRFARGEQDLEADPKIAILARHRKPATPPRQPLLASRDLPSPIISNEVAIAPAPSVVTLTLAQPLTSPQSPEPLSDEDIASMVTEMPPMRDRVHGPYGAAAQLANLRPQTAQEALAALIIFAHQTPADVDAAILAEPANDVPSPEPVILMLPSPTRQLDRAVDEQLTDALAKLRELSSTQDLARTRRA